MTVRKFVPESEIKVAGDGTITAVLSSEAVDRDGEIIRAAGWQLDNFLKSPRLMANHDYGIESQIGTWKNVHVDGNKLIGEPHYFSGKGNFLADYGAELAKMGQATFSVGFIPIETQPLGKGAYGPQEYLKQELLECSHVAIPANPEAVQMALKSWESNKQTSHSLASVLGMSAEDFEALVQLGVLLKAGRTQSGSSMSQIHTILNAAHSLHSAGQCSDGDCPYGGDDGKGKAMNEGDGPAGGATVSDSGTHGAYDGSHTHDHNDTTGDGLHSHEHSHDGNGDHNHAHGGKSFDLAAAIEQALEGIEI